MPWPKCSLKHCYARVLAKVQTQYNIRKIHNPDHILFKWTLPVSTATWKHKRSFRFISVRICSLSSARSGIWLWHSRGAAVTRLSLQFKRFQRLGMITAHGAISQYTTALYLDCLSRSITGSGPNNIAVCSVRPHVSIYKDRRFWSKRGWSHIQSSFPRSLSLSIHLSGAQRERELEENPWEKIANGTKRRDEHQDYKTWTILRIFYCECAVKTCW